METLIEKSLKKIREVPARFKRYLHGQIDWNDRYIALLGARGTGKTTLLLQYIKENLPLDKSIYLSLDDLYFTKNTLVDTVTTFEKKDYRYFFIDEVHKYPNWSIELKNLYDDLPNIKVVVTGSSILKIYEGYADLSRRVISYPLASMSLREFIIINKHISLPDYNIEDLLKGHVEIAMELTKYFKPIKELIEFNHYGAYPYFTENKKTYHARLENVVQVIFNSDIPSIENIDYSHLIKMKKLLKIISELVPFKPNISKLASLTEIDRKTLYKYLDILEKANLIHLLNKDSKGDAVLNKPEKIYLHNTNLLVTLCDEKPNVGTMRETFFLNQVKQSNKITYSDFGDFKVNDTYTFEIGGMNKTFEQIKEIKGSYIVKDDLEIGFGNTIPLWLFGFLY